MFIYILIFLLMLFGFFHYDVRNKTLGKEFYYSLIFISLTLMLGFRYRVGGDSLAYEGAYPAMPTFSDIFKYGLYGLNAKLKAYQPLWIILIAFCKSIGKEYYIFQLVHAFIVNLLLFIFLKKNTIKPFAVLLFLYTTHYYFYFTIEIEREVLAMVVFLFNIKNLQNKNWLRYYLLAIVSFMFHISSLFLFFLPLLVIFNITKKQIVLITILLTPLVFFKSVIMDVLAPILFLESMSDKIKDYSEIKLSFLGTLSFYIIRVICFIPFLFTAFRIKRKEQLWIYNVYIMISVLSLALVGFERLLNYLLIPLIISFIELLYEIKKFRMNIFQRYIIILLTFFNFFFNIPWRLFTSNDKGEHYYALFFPYVSIFDEQIILERENYIIHQWDL